MVVVTRYSLATSVEQLLFRSGASLTSPNFVVASLAKESL